MNKNRVSVRDKDRSFDATLHFLITDKNDNKEEIVAVSYVGVPEAVTAINASIIENRPLYVEPLNKDFQRSGDAFRRIERKIGEGDVVHGMVFNSLTTLEGIESQLDEKNSGASYVISLNNDLHENIARHIQTRFGLPKEWLSEYVTLFTDMITPLRVTKNEELTSVLWPNVEACRFEGDEESVLGIIKHELARTSTITETLKGEGLAVSEENLRKHGAKLVIPKSEVTGRFHPEWSMKEYMVNNSEVFAKKLANLKPRHNVGDPIDPALSELKRIPFPAQANMIQALVNTLDYEKSVGCSGDMGTGKSIISVGVVKTLHERKKRNGSKRGTAVLLSAPGITLKKWKTKEILETLPEAKVHVINNSTDAIQLMNKVKKGYQPNGIEFYLVGIDKAKRSPEPFFAGIWKRIKGTVSQYGWHCPDCGSLLTKVVDEEVVPLEWQDMAHSSPPPVEELEELRLSHRLGINGLPKDSKVKWRRNRKVMSCQNKINKHFGDIQVDESEEEDSEKCQSKLWRPAIRRSGEQSTRLWKGTVEKKQETRNKKSANISRILRRMNRWFDLYICDEVHQCKSGDSGRGDAFSQMVLAAKKNLLLTGTLVNGKSSSIKEILWRTDSKMLLDAGIDHKTGDLSWAERYGKLKQVVKMEEAETGWNTTRKRKPQQPTEEPGIAPSMTSQFLLHKFGFMEISDMGLPLVELKEIPQFIDMDKEHFIQYQQFHEKLFDHCRKVAMAGGKGAFSKFIPATINYGDRPDLGARVVFGSSEEDQTIISAPPIEGLHAKERHLLELVKKELKENRRCVIFNEYTGGYQVNERIKSILEEEGISCEILGNDVSTDKRSDKLQEFEANEVPVIICNMTLVEVGLDLLYWPTIIFNQLNYQVSKIRQASRRSFRIGQDRECRVYYLVYNGSQQMSQFLRIMSARGHALMTEGRLDKSELAQYARDGQSSLASDLANCFASSDVADAWTKLAAKELEDVELVAEANFKEVLSTRMKALAHQTLRMCGLDPTNHDIDLKEQIITWIDATITSRPTKNVFMKRIDEVVARVENGVTGFFVENGMFKVDYIEAFGFSSISDGQLLMYLLDEEQPEEQESVFNLIEATAVNQKGNRKKKVAEGQLMFDLFAL